MFLRFSTTLLVAMLAVASVASAERIAGVSHRARLYDSASHDANVFVVGYPGLVLRSTDKGQHFAPIAVPTQDALFSIDINKAGLGAISGRGGLVLISTDAGASWTKTNALADTAEGVDKPHLFAIDVLESGTIVAVGDFASIVVSTDQGKTWQKRSFDPTDPGVGKAAEARDGLLGREENENQGFEDEARLTGVSFGDDKNGYVVGEFGIVLKSEDGGASWKRQHSAADQLLFSVHATSGNHAVVSGSDGLVAETTDGQTWAVVPTPTKNHLFGIWASADVCIAVGQDGAAVVRKRAGAQFQVVPTHVHTWLSSVALHDVANGVIAGGLGHLLGTKDAGQSFGLITGE